jgi:hypothetical protein
VTVSNLWNVSWIQKVGGWDESLLNLQEYYLMFEILKNKGSVAFSEKNLTKIFSQPNSITMSTQYQDKKRDNYFIFRKEVRDYLLSINEFSLVRKHYYEISTGNMLRYHHPPFAVELNKPYFYIYRFLKSIFADTKPQ